MESEELINTSEKLKNEELAHMIYDTEIDKDLPDFLVLSYSKENPNIIVFNMKIKEIRIKTILSYSIILKSLRVQTEKWITNNRKK